MSGASGAHGTRLAKADRRRPADPPSGGLSERPLRSANRAVARNEPANAGDFAFFADVKAFVKRGCRFHRLRAADKLSAEDQAAEKTWLRDELARLETCEVTHEKAITLQARLLRHPGEWLVFLDDPRVPPTNNLAERALRPLVVLRKITFGHRSDAGAKRMATLMSVAETARRRGHRASRIYFECYTRPPDRVLRSLYAKA